MEQRVHTKSVQAKIPIKYMVLKGTVTRSSYSSNASNILARALASIGRQKAHDIR